MAVIFGSDAGVRENHAESFSTKMTQEFSRIKEGITDNFNRLSGKPGGIPRPQKENVFVDSGFSNVPGTAFLGSTVDNVDDIQTRRITTQEPHLTVYIKKRAFWSLRAENDTRFMDSGEKLYLRATKILFEKKCSQLAAYEALTKLSRLVSEDSEFDALPVDQTREILREFNRNSIDVAETELKTLSGDASVLKQLEINGLKSDISDLEDMLESMQQVADMVRKTSHATQTNWVVDGDDADVVNVGRGSGVIELTLVSDMNSSLGIEGDEGSVSFTVQDPYNLTKISTDDVETSLSAATREQASITKKFDDLFNGIGSIDGLIGGANRGPAAILEEVREKDNELKKLRKNKIANNFGLGQNAAPLTTSDATEIIFEINPTSIASNKVTGSVATIPEPFNKDNFRIVLGQLPVEERLGVEEDRLVTRIFNLLDLYVAKVESMNRSIKADNKNDDVIYARRQLRSHYLGKSIVQPMDGIHMYIRSKTRKPGELIGPLNSLLNNNKFVKLFADDEEVNSAIVREEMKQFGLDEIDLSEQHYKDMRSSSMLRNAGMHVFGGLVSNVTESYSGGVYTLNVSGHSNLKWLRLSRVNVRPSLDQTQGVLEDPLTPFEIKTDPATGLIVEEPELIQINKLRLDILNHNQTQHAGTKLSTDDAADYTDDGSGGEPQKVLPHVPGLTYKWKQGVMVATRNVNLKTALDGSPNQLAKFRREVGMTITETPFANLDAADVVSLLVTGFPHNYESFFENARVTGSFNDNVQNNSPQSYFHSFFDIQRSTNRALGNFHPFKTMDVDQKQMANRLRIQSDLRNDSSELRTLRKELAELQDELASLDVSIERAPNINNDRFAQSIQTTIESLVAGINQKKGAITRRVVDFKKITGKDGPAELAGLRVYGNDISLDFEVTGVASEQDATDERRKTIQLSNKLLRLRTQFNCKFNNDKNLFIVADEYDKDLDIQAFVLNSIGSQEIPLWNSEYAVPLETCQKVAKTLDFEFFCDTQGHIRFKPPTYNKVPLSLILKLFLLDHSEGKQLFPSFLRNLFTTKAAGLEDEIDIVDQEIEIEAVLLNIDIFGRSTGFVADQIQENIISPTESEALGGQFTLNINAASGSAARTLIDARNRLTTKIGGKIIDPDNPNNIADAVTELAALNDPSSQNVNSSRLSHINRISQLVSRRQRLANEKVKADQQRDTVNKTNIPRDSDFKKKVTSTFGNLIADDLHDFLGPGSASRFIIYDDQIIDYKFSESDDNVICRVNVTGQQDLTGDKPGDLAGVPVLWAGGTDFDLWRQYGYRPLQEHQKPFFKNAEAQCAPYVLFLLSRARRDIVRGTVTLYGNEYYQLGDVVYINSRDMLYYVTGISHNFSYAGGTFTTTLTLRYGHPLGEYIPTPLDIIGKSLIRNQRKFNKVVTSRETADPQRGIVIGVVAFPPQDSGNGKADMLGGPFSLYNIIELKNALEVANVHLRNDPSIEFPRIELRSYVVDDDSAKSKAATLRMKAVREWLKNPTGRRFRGNKDKYITLGKRFTEIKLQDEKINKTSTAIDPVNIKEELTGENLKQLRIPSEEAFSVSINGDAVGVVEIVLLLEKGPE